MQSLSASANCTNGSRASRTFSGITSFTFCPKLGLEHLGNRVPILFTRPRVALISSVRAATNASRARSTTKSCRTSRLRCRIGCNDCGSTRPSPANFFASIRSFLRLRRFDPSISRGLATTTSCPSPATAVWPGGTLRLLLPSSVAALRLASPLANPKCRSGSFGLLNPLPPSAGPDWVPAPFPDSLLLGAPTSPSAPAFLAVSPPARPVLPWVLAALGAELSPASLSVPSSWQTCYSSSRVDLLVLRDCTASALITGSLARYVIGDRPSQPISIYGPPPNCKRFEVGRRYSPRKCIRPLGGEFSPGTR